MPSKSFHLTLSAMTAAGVLAAVTVPTVAAARPALPTAESRPLTLAAATNPTVPPVRDARTVFSAMSLAQRVGQLFMVGTPASSADAATLSQIGRYHVGNVMLTGRNPGRARAGQDDRGSIQRLALNRHEVNQ